MRDGLGKLAVRAAAVAGLAAMVILTQACSFSASSKGSANSSESSSDSSASSSRSSSPESAETQYKSDVREYTAAYTKSGGQFDAFRRGIGDIAKKHNITNWEDNPATYEGIGAGAGGSGSDRPPAQGLHGRPGRAGCGEACRHAEGLRRQEEVACRSSAACSWLAVMLLAGPGQTAAAETPPGVEYLYVESNEGGSSGGHVALRVGDDVFHFEHRSPGILVLGRDDFEHFRYRYSVLENRTIHVSRLAVSGETAGLLADRFGRRHFLQRRHLDVIESLRADRTTLEEMLSDGIVVEAAGYFFSDHGRVADPAPLIEDPDLADLRARVALAHGADFLERRMTSVRAALAELDPLVMDLPELPTAEMPPAPAYSFPQRYRDLMGALASLQALRDARPLVPGSLRPGDSDDLAFTEADSLAVRRLSDALAAALVRLVASDRPDGGVALMAGMARLAALGASRRQERWVVVDFFPSETTPAARRGLT